MPWAERFDVAGSLLTQIAIWILSIAVIVILLIGAIFLVGLFFWINGWVVLTALSLFFSSVEVTTRKSLACGILLWVFIPIITQFVNLFRKPKPLRIDLGDLAKLSKQEGDNPFEDSYPEEEEDDDGQ